ncbi:MAG: hypothetical protein K5928_07870 [Prevotella sp.]|nr:hypothetical protein [Prevotella sp.]
MNKQYKALLVAFWMPIVMCAVLALLFETGTIPTGLFIDMGEQAEFFTLTVVELLTVAAIPLTLKYAKRQVLRIAILNDLLTLNTLLYYLFMNTSFGYMAIILLIVLAFAYPRREYHDDKQ